MKGSPPLDRLCCAESFWISGRKQSSSTVILGRFHARFSLFTDSPSLRSVLRCAPARSPSCRTCAGPSAEPETTEFKSDRSVTCSMRRVDLNQRLTSRWDSGVTLGNFSSPTVTESTESSVEGQARNVMSRTSLKCDDKSWGDSDL